MLGSSMFDLHWEHPRLPWEAHVYSAAHSARWPPRTSPSTGFFEGHRLCGGSSKHIFIQFTWKDLRLLRDAVFEVISLCNCILHRAVMTWVTQFFFLKRQEHGHGSSATTLIMSHKHVNCHGYLCLISECAMLCLFIATVKSIIRLRSLRVITYSTEGKIKQKSESSLPVESLEIMFPLVSLFSLLTWDHLEKIKQREMRWFREGLIEKKT